ncbi:MAG: dihydrodipicolinate synthase family protein, partial [Halanaerobiales bacterium]
VVKTVNNRVPVLIGTGSTVMDEVIKLTQYAEKEGADGAAVITPYFFQFKEKALYNFFAKIASNTSLPIYLYNFPARSGVNISPELALKLGKNYTNIVGIKDSVGSIGHTRDLIIKTKGELNEFTVYSGFDEYFIPNLITGGDGVVGGLTNIIPGIFSDLYKAYQDQDFNKISNFCNQISNLMKLYDISQPFIPAIKQAVAIVRNKEINCTCKEPITDLTHTQINRIEKILKNAEIV